MKRDSAHAVAEELAAELRKHKGGQARMGRDYILMKSILILAGIRVREEKDTDGKPTAVIVDGIREEV